VVESDADGDPPEARLLPRERELLLVGGVLKYLREGETIEGASP
jgi:hypothetical protein